MAELIYDVVHVRQYEKNGEKKSFSTIIGKVMQTNNGSLMLKLDMVPLGWDGFAFLNDPSERKGGMGSGGGSAHGGGYRSGTGAAKPQAAPRPAPKADPNDDIPF